MNLLQERLEKLVQKSSGPVLYRHNDKWFYIENSSIVEGNRDSIFKYCTEKAGINYFALSDAIVALNMAGYNCASFGILSKSYICSFSIL